MIYLDYNATAPLRSDVRHAMLSVLDLVGNASSVHRYGRQVRQSIESVRQIVADYFAVQPKQVVFTSGATEANNMILQSFKGPVIVSAVEHDSVRLVRDDAYICPVNDQGIIDLVALEVLLSTIGPCLVSVMGANNETGVIQPLIEVVALARRYGALIHTDLVQLVGKTPLNWAELGVDFATLSAHKFGGPQGVGAILMNPRAILGPLQKGGGQERSFRPGTENTLGIIGLGAALKAAVQDDWRAITRLRNMCEEKLQAICPEICIFSQKADRLPNTTNLTMPGVKSVTQVMRFDLEGVALSAGAACSSGKVKTSPTLLAMGVASDIADTAIRVSLGPTTTLTEIETFVMAWQRLYNQPRSENSNVLTAA